MRLIDADVYKGTLNMLRYGNHLNKESLLNLAEIALDEQYTVDPVKPMWFSVADKLPEIDQKVLVYDVDEGTYDMWSMSCDNEGYYWSDMGGFWSDLDSVTHWMPLPEPPESGE